jgi:hypothetical protein
LKYEKLVSPSMRLKIWEIGSLAQYF